MEKQLSLELGGRVLTIETGKIAKQADTSVWVKYGDTVLLTTVVSKTSYEKRDFLPLLVEYREQTFAAGKIPGGFFKREGRPREREILYGRAIDRSIRPRFPDGMIDEIEVTSLLLSYDMENEGHLLGIIGASAALSASPIPFDGPIAAVQVGQIDGKFVLNPTNSQLEKSTLDLLVVGSGNDEVNMIELGAREASNETVVDAIEFAIPYIKQIVEMQKELRDQIGLEKREPTKIEIPEKINAEIDKIARADIRDAMRITEKKSRNETLDMLEKKALETLSEKYPDSEVEIKTAFYEIEREEMRRMIVEEGVRPDGRGTRDIRPISAEVSLLPRTHGSALFTRGETQALVVTTLGTYEDEQRLSELELEERKRFMLHYNFPPFSVGEVQPMRGPSRREIGHGNLAEKALLHLIPEEEKFPYTIRVVSTITESNGSTSMATVCGGTLSLMDAGVPIKKTCAGISTGLIHENGRFILLTDIQGMEDHFGDMDFKVAGTRDGITAIQLDLKIKGLPLSVLKETLEEAKRTRLYILDVMERVLPAPRKELSKYAPKVTAIWIPREKIGAVIGPGGRIIRNIQEVTNTKIDIEDTTGKVMIAGDTREHADEARRMIEELVQEVEVGKVYTGKVVKTTSFGAFVEILPGKEGLVHISELALERIKSVEDVVRVGDKIAVKVIGIDDQGKIRLSRKALLKSGAVKVIKVDHRMK